MILLIFILLIVVYLCYIFTPIYTNDYSHVDIKNIKYKIISHRGGSLFAPENTFASIKKALNINSTRIEIDVQQTKDSIVILMHDITLDRTTNGNGLIKKYNYPELQNLDAGSWFSESYKGEIIPKLEDVIKYINGKCELVIEIKKGKEFYPHIEETIVDLILKNNAEKWIIIHSFDTEVLSYIHSISTKVRLQKIFFTNLPFTPLIIDKKISKFKIEDYPYIEEYNIYYLFANRNIIKKIKQNNKKINVWTVNNLKDAKELIAIGVDGIITDNNDIMKSTIKKAE